MEGYCVEFYNKSGERKSLFYSVMSDEKKQDAATTHQNLSQVIDDLLEKGEVDYDTFILILDHTDGCSAQYWCGNALFHMALYALMHKTRVDRHQCTAGHGKWKVDPEQGEQKKAADQALSHQVAMPWEDEAEGIRVKVESSTVKMGETVSLAAQLHKVLSHPDRIHGAKAYKKNEKRRDERDIDDVPGGRKSK